MCKGVKLTSDQLVLEGNAKYLERTQCLLMGMHKAAQQYFHWPKTEKLWINIFSAEKSIDKYTMVFSTSKNPDAIRVTPCRVKNKECHVLFTSRKVFIILFLNIHIFKFITLSVHFS